MPFLTASERAFLATVSAIGYCNPFLPERTRLERVALGKHFVEGEAVWSLNVDEPKRPRENAWRIVARIKPLMERLRDKLAAGEAASTEDLVLYEDAALQLLFNLHYASLYQADAGEVTSHTRRWHFYREFLADWRNYFQIDGVTLPTGHEPAHTFACFRQIQRAFNQILHAIIGSSLAAAKLRAAVWQSIFSHDMRRYRRTLYSRMGDFVTLITGPSGTGKELVARAIGNSRYVRFDERTMSFVDEGKVLFFPINISALSPTLVESELFGHKRGAFTGAVGDRKGWLEMCSAPGTVFLDELGDLDPAIQVKLLRVIETRTFHPVGETTNREFRGKLIAATNRDLAAGIRNRRFREDLYYRLCSDQIATPALAEQIADSPGVLRELVVYLARKVAGEEAEVLAPEVIQWIEQNLEPDYGWPGNYRELEQCVKNVLIRRDYRPSGSSSGEPAETLAEDIRECRLTAAELLSRYCTLAYARAGTLEAAASRLGLDRRTIRSHIDAALRERGKSTGTRLR